MASSKNANQRSWLGDDPFDLSGVWFGEVSDGVPPIPVNEFIFKVQSRCNLNCDYCYVYNMADSSWRNQPLSMTEVVAEQAALRIRDHVVAHDIPVVAVMLHGGEPLLGGVEPVAKIIDVLRRVIGPVAELQVSMQTNATLVTEQVAAELASMNVGVGVSVDGDKLANDRHRLDHRGRSSSAALEAGLATLLEHKDLLRGVLCVIDVANDPVDVLEHLTSLEAPAIDFLLPLGNWQDRPPGKEDAVLGDRGSPAPYGDWLCAVYDHWAPQPRSQSPRIRIFEDIIHLLLGGIHSYEGLGLDPVTLLVIESDGSIELVDHLKSVTDGASATGASVFTHSLGDILKHPGVRVRQLGLYGVGPECHACPVVTTCGGGLISDRWHEDRGFAAPTIHCSDMYRLITHIAADLDRRIARTLRTDHPEVDA